jgi:hypothetical protein
VLFKYILLFLIFWLHLYFTQNLSVAIQIGRKFGQIWVVTPKPVLSRMTMASKFHSFTNYAFLIPVQRNIVVETWQDGPRCQPLLALGLHCLFSGASVSSDMNELCYQADRSASLASFSWIRWLSFRRQYIRGPFWFSSHPTLSLFLSPGMP